MKLQLPNAVTTRFARQVLVAQKNAPQVLFVGGLALMGATVVSACRGTLKLESTLDEIRADREAVLESASSRDTAKLNYYVTVKGVAKVAQLYLPAAIYGSLAVAALTKSHTILNKRNAGLSAALAATEKALDRYRERVREELGEDKDREFMFGTEKHEVETQDKNGKKTKKKVVRHGEGRSPYSRIWGRDTTPEWCPQPEYNLAKLRAVQEYATHRLNSRGHLFLNEVYDELGLERTSAGAVVGWLSRENGGSDGAVDFMIMQGGKDRETIDFMCGNEDHILLDFNVDGEIWRNI